MTATFTTRTATNGTDVHVLCDGWAFDTVIYSDGEYVTTDDYYFPTLAAAMLHIVNAL